MTEEAPRKEDLQGLLGSSRGPVAKYREFFVGRPGLLNLLKYEFASVVAAPMPGAVGYLLRKVLLPGLLHSVGTNVNFGRNLSLRHPGNVSIGDRTAIDDSCLLDARGVAPGQFTIGSDVIVARGNMLTAKTDRGFIEIGDHCTIGKACILASTGGIRLGNWVGVSGGCYLGGGLYRTDNPDIPIMKQDLYTRGPVIIGDNCWLGAGVVVLDGVEIGANSIIAAGVVVREDVPAGTLVAPRHGPAMVSRALVDPTGPDRRPAADDLSCVDEDPRADSEPRANGAPGVDRAVALDPSSVAAGSAIDSGTVLECVYRAMESVNRTLPPGKRLTRTPDTVLMGNEALDSLGLVNLVVETEMALEEAFGRRVDLAGGGDGDLRPLENAASLAAHVHALLERE